MSALAHASVDSQTLTELRALARRVAARLVSSAEDAEDIAQESVLRATQQWGRVGAYARPWTVRVATNLAIAQLRRDGRAHPVAIGAGADEGAELRIDLAEAVRALPVRQRQAVVLRYLADHDEATVAALLGCSRGTVKRHLHRATQALRQSPRLLYAHDRGDRPMAKADWKSDFIPAVEPAGGWPARPWDHWFIQQNGSRDRVAVDETGQPVLDADGDEVMSGPGFNHAVVKLRPRAEPDPPEQPDPRPAANGELAKLLDEAFAYAAWCGHPWVGDEHLGLALAARGEFGEFDERTLLAAVAQFYEGPWAEARVAIVRAREAGAEFPRQPDENFSWTWALSQTLAGAAAPSPSALAAALVAKPRSFIVSLLGRLDG